MPSNRVTLSASLPGRTPEGVPMRQRLSDPIERARVRAEHLEYLRHFYPQLAEALGLDALRETRFFDLLIEEQMTHLDQLYAEEPGEPSRGDPHAELLARQAQANHKQQQIRQLLGEGCFERYVDYMDALSELRQVLYFEQRLAADERLAADQRGRLMSLLRAQRDRDIARRQAESHLHVRPVPDLCGTPASREQCTAELNQDDYLRMRDEYHELLRQLPAVLTPPQLDAYAQMQAEVLDRQAQFVRQLRADAGLEPDFDVTQPRALPPKRTPLCGRVRFEMELTIDRHPPIRADWLLDNGSTSEAIQASEGLWVEATPTLYEDGWAYYEVTFYEDRHGRRVRLDGGVSVGGLRRDRDGSSSPNGRAFSSFSSRGKVYVISAATRLTAAE
jgi:hypothetical protein